MCTILEGDNKHRHCANQKTSLLCVLPDVKLYKPQMLVSSFLKHFNIFAVQIV